MTSVRLSHGSLPNRLRAAGWARDVFVRGPAPGDGPAVAVVGARAASREGMARAHRVGRRLAVAGIHVVSGGALGIDGAAHRGALAGGGLTTAVLGSGTDVWYPARHAPLFDEILASGGALMSLVPDGTAPRPGMFSARNPLIAALADVVIVVEAEVASGSLSTARAARELGRVVAAWPGSRGCDRLLASGAALIEHEDDAVAALTAPRYPAEPAEPADPAAAQVRSALGAGARDVDAIAARTGLPTRDIVRALARIDAPLAPSFAPHPAGRER